MTTENIYRASLKMYDNTGHLFVTIEEMSELAKELSKYYRTHVGSPLYYDSESISEEIADVEIMIGQLKLMFDNANRVEEWKCKKLNRLEEKLIKKLKREAGNSTSFNELINEGERNLLNKI